MLTRLCLLLLLVLSIAACQQSGSPGSPSSITQPAASPTNQVSPTKPTPPAAGPGTALAAALLMKVKGRGSMTGYDRAVFGQAWADVDRNGCDTRNDVLRRDLKSKTLKADTNGCLVLSGVLRDPYTGHTIHFTRGQVTSTLVQIDHVVALGDAWQMGAKQWSLTTRTRFANDPLNLLAVGGAENEAKGDADAASWLPSAKVYRCSYVARQVAVKAKYALAVTKAEQVEITTLLTGCPQLRLPTSRAIPLGGGRVATVTSSPSLSTKPSSGLDPRYGTCGEANADGYGPYRRGVDPEYAWYQDRDGDGLDCER